MLVLNLEDGLPFWSSKMIRVEVSERRARSGSQGREAGEESDATELISLPSHEKSKGGKEDEIK